MSKFTTEEKQKRLLASARDMYDLLDVLRQFLQRKSSCKHDEFANYLRIINALLKRIDGTENVE